MFLTCFANLVLNVYSPAHVFVFQDGETGVSVSYVGLISRKLIAVVISQVPRFYSNCALKMKWCDGYDCNNLIGGNCNSACKHVTIGGNSNNFAMCRNWFNGLMLQCRIV